MGIKRFICIFLILCIALSSLLFVSCSGSKKNDAFGALIDDFDGYASLVNKYADSENKEEAINEIYDYVVDKSRFVLGAGERDSLSVSLKEAVILANVESSDFNSKTEDINADGNDELMFYGPGDTLIALFASSNGDAILLDSFYSRYRAKICSNGRIQIVDSRLGYTKTTSSLYEIGKGGDSLELIGECCAELSDDNGKLETKYYYLHDGEKKNISEERYNEIIELFSRGETVE